MNEATTGLLWFGAIQLPVIWMVIVFSTIAIFQFVTVCKETVGGSTFFLLVLVAFIHLTGVADIASMVAYHPGQLLLFIAIYVLLGVGWVIVKYKSFLRKNRESILENLSANAIEGIWDSYRNPKRNEPFPGVDSEDYKAFRNLTLQDCWDKSKPSNNWELLTIWLVWWPFSVTWTLLGDWLYDFARYVVIDVLGKQLQAMWQAEMNRLKGNP